MKKFKVFVKTTVSYSKTVKDHWWSEARTITEDFIVDEDVTVKADDEEHAIAEVENMIALTKFFNIAKFVKYYASSSAKYEIVRAEVC